jgi:lipopolysaccharide biosynthesis regulator YciM
MQSWPLTLGAAAALVMLGILLGRAWVLARQRRSDGSQYGDHPHYLLGLNYLISNQPDLALVELSKAVRGETDAVEAYRALGNLFREKGQVERAIDIHKSLLHRPGLSELGRTQALFSLALDFKSAGLIDRSERTLDEVVKRDPENLSGLLCLRRVYEEMGRWREAAETQGRIDRLAGSSDTRLLASLWAECGKEAHRNGDAPAAAGFYRKALDLDPDYAPAHLGLGDCLADGTPSAEALAHWSKVLDNGAPAWAMEALERISTTAIATRDWERAEQACARVLERQPHSWRVQLVLARLHRERGELEPAREALTKALTERPGSITVQRELWEVLDAQGAPGSAIGDLFTDVVGQARLIDPYVCLQCGFKATRPFARCPHCHGWNTVADEQG